jgi:hypothetical protein
LFGNVVRASKLPKKGNAYAWWEDLVLGGNQIDLQGQSLLAELFEYASPEEILVARRVSAQKISEKLFEDDLVKSLFGA